MGIRISLKDFGADILSPKASALVSEFALILYRRKGVFIDVGSDDVLLKVFKNAKRYNDRSLLSIYLHIEAELSNMLINSIPDFDAMSLNDSMLHITPRDLQHR